MRSIIYIHIYIYSFFVLMPYQPLDIYIYIYIYMCVCVCVYSSIFVITLGSFCGSLGSSDLESQKVINQNKKPKKKILLINHYFLIEKKKNSSFFIINRFPPQILNRFPWSCLCKIFSRGKNSFKGFLYFICEDL